MTDLSNQADSTLGAFTILIGSCARGTARTYSDVDIVRIGHRTTVRRQQLGDRIREVLGPVTYVDYDTTEFRFLFESGSLFLYHILTEGNLIAGNERSWVDLLESFRVATDFSVEIDEYLGVCYWLADSEGFKHAVMPRLAHLSRALKNAAIFLLAAKKIYVFEKTTAIIQAFPSMLPSDIQILIDASNTFDRDVPPTGLLNDLMYRDSDMRIFCRRILLNLREV